MRNPKNSWEKSDSHYDYDCKNCVHLGENWECTEPNGICTTPPGFVVGIKDLALMKSLYQAGQPHRKYLRQIQICADVTAPLYWWKEADQYRVGVTTDSCSTMHTIHKKEFELDDFSHEHLLSPGPLLRVVTDLNFYRRLFIETKEKQYWWQMIQLLPSSYNQKRTMTFNYEVAVNMIESRENHKLDEWREFVWILKSLPYMKEIIDEENK
jgi:hypothetical protein